MLIHSRCINYLKNQIYVTYFGGEGRLQPDDKFKNLWVGVLPPEHVLSFGCNKIRYPVIIIW